MTHGISKIKYAPEDVLLSSLAGGSYRAAPGAKAGDGSLHFGTADFSQVSQHYQAPFGSSKPTLPVSQGDHQVHWQEARKFSSGKLCVVGCWLIKMFYVLTWNLLALTDQCFPVQWCAVRNLMISCNCHFDGQNLCWPESHNFLAITKYLYINTNKKKHILFCAQQLWNLQDCFWARVLLRKFLPSGQQCWGHTCPCFNLITAASA